MKQKKRESGRMKLVVEVTKIRGRCPVYRLGDKIVLDEGYRVNLEQTDALCMHALASILPYYNVLAKGISPVELGLATQGDAAYIQCLDPMEHTGGGTVIFKIWRVREGSPGLP
ncbi:MAG: TIGR04076 family protein [Candidatus Aminicenantales bacterium]